MSSVAVVTGGSSGIGLAVCRELSARGCAVYELSRRLNPDCPAKHISCDVADWQAVSAAVQAVADEQGRIDILVSNAGFGISGAVEFTEHEAAQRQMDVNFLGTAGAVRAVLPYMRAQGSGRIVCVSSVAAPIAIPFQAFYSASKAAINALVLALSGEVSPYGISICAVMPGDIKTGFTGAREKQHAGDEEYGGRISKSVAVMERDELGGMPPETAARRIAALALKKHVRPLYAVGLKYSLFVMLSRLLPAKLVARIAAGIYAS